ncbi:GTPase Era [Oscillospiraceae bacterium OttesenSCG-928-G22]|nr:GTPase Era [Oscillospiraceae bacterium OttesenSCG-928-G22]
MKTGMFAIVGRPNVGKSTLLNRFTGEKVAIVTPKPQTTRNRITGIVTTGEKQLVFLDTPGFHKAKTKLSDYMNRVVRDSVAGVDAALLVVPPVPSVGTPEKLLIDRIREEKIPAILVVNKIDEIRKDLLLPVIDAYRNAHPFDAIFPISAKTGEGIPELLAELDRFLLDGPMLFPDGEVSDQPERQVMAEIIREKLLRTLDEEIPHGTAVEIELFSDRSDDLIDISAVIYCEKKSHKGMIIGKRGAKLKEIGSLARADMERFMGAKIFLELYVKVKENWRQSDIDIKNFGYEE